MQTFRITVLTRQQNALNRWVETARQLHLDSLTGCFSARLFFVRGGLTQSDAERLARELLADSVVEDFTVADVSVGTRHIAPLPYDHLIEVTLQPGVTDSVAENMLSAAQQLGIAVEQAATGQSFGLQGTIPAEELHLLAEKVFCNTVIQRYEIDMPITPPFVAAQPGDGLVETIALRNADETGLLAISKERRLSLDLNEMRAIQTYYQGEGREPTDIELEMLAQTWSEHCVHKTFRAVIDFTDDDGKTETINGLLKTYIRAATEKVNKPWVRSAFVDNAGIIAFNDEFDIAFKVETHNHPSALEPFGGANTGVGGVVRDVLGVSARPIANTDVLLFGEQDLPEDQLPEGVLHPSRIEDGVIHGIEDYGNKMGIPTVGGAIFYDNRYTANPLVFCGCLGILPHGSHRAEAQSGDLIVVLGGRTGRDGLRGATFSSMEMDTTTSEIASVSVQIGHPIHEKQTLEVILRARDEGLYTAITDCGAGGLSSAVGEMGKELGANVELTTVPLKYPGLRPWEIWLSEAQERMVLAVPQAKWARLQALAAAQDSEIVSIGTFEATGCLKLHYEGKLVGELSMAFLHDGIPTRHLKAEWKANLTPQPPLHQERGSIAPTDINDTLLKLLAHPNIRSKEAVIRRYDHEVQGGTVVKPLVGTQAHGHGDGTVIVPLDTIPLTPSPSPTGGEGNVAAQTTIDQKGIAADEPSLSERIYVPPALEQIMRDIARKLRRESTPSEDILWQSIRGKKLDGRKFRRQQPVGAFVLDFYCSSERLAVEIDGAIHVSQQEADQQRQELLEDLGIRFVRVSADVVEKNLTDVLNKIRAAFDIPPFSEKPTSGEQLARSDSPSPLVGEGAGGEGLHVKGIAIGHGICPQYGEHDPYAMAWAAVDEAFRNLVAVGADPDTVALLDNFCWGNPNLPDRLGSLVLAAKGCHDAALAYNAPFISGKDSLNNEYTDADGTRHAIPGTLLISAIGSVPDVTKTVTMDLKQAGNLLYVIGETRDEMGGSHYNRIHNIEGGTVPQPNSNALEVMRALHKAIQAGLVQACHDVSEGGIAVALAEMCIAGGLGAVGITAELSLPMDVYDTAQIPLFSETTGRFIVEIRREDEEQFKSIMERNPVRFLGGVAGDRKWAYERKDKLRLLWGGFERETPFYVDLEITDLERAWRGHIPAAQPAPEYAMPAQVLSPSPMKPPRVKTTQPRALILHANGSNRDRDAALACELAGAAPDIVHINQLSAGEKRLNDYDMLIIPGGFSYGDDMGAGVLWAQALRYGLRDDLAAFIQRGSPVLGICNGFQVLVKAGILPYADFASGDNRRVTLTYNESGHFECRPVYLKPQAGSVSLFTDGLSDLILCPVAHGEGRIMARDTQALHDLIEAGLVPLTYTDANGTPVGYPGNPNGSQLGIAALCNPAGNVMGLMPHPENHIFPWQHPRYHRGERGNTGLALFQNMVRFA